MDRCRDDTAGGGLVLWDGKAGLGSIGDLPEAIEAIQDKWVHGRVYAIAASMLLLGLIGFGRSAWRLRGLLWLTLCFGGFFALYSGDWMKAFRWFNPVGPALRPPRCRSRVPGRRTHRPGRGCRASGRTGGFWGASGRRALLFAAPVLALGTLAIMKTVDFAYGPETATGTSTGASGT